MISTVLATRSSTKQSRIRTVLLASSAFLLASCTGENISTPEASESSANKLAFSQAGAITNERLKGAHSEPEQWLTGGRDYQQSYYSPLDKINEGNIDQLGVAWTYDIDSEDGFEATPIVVDGMMYASGPRGSVYVLNAETGEEIWTFLPEIDPQIYRKVCCGVVNRGLTVWKGNVYVASLDGYLYALDAKSGDIVWKSDTIVDRERGYSVTGSPYMAGDLVIIGNSGAELDARGYVTAYDYKTGEEAWRFYTVPGNPSNGFEHPELEMAAKTWDENSLWEAGLGGTVWDGMAYDPELDLLYVGTGNSAPYPRKLRSPSGGDNLFLASILAINPKTGKLVWHYQSTPGENWDYTATQKMILADMVIKGENRKVIMQAPKNGFFYVIDRETGELISADPYVQVNWASHVDLETGRPVETGQGEYFEEPKLVFPGPAGGHNWQPMAYNPDTGLVYIPAMEAPAIFSMVDAPYTYQKGQPHFAAKYIFPVPGPWGFGSEIASDLPPFSELSEGQPDPTVKGILKAWDPVQKKVVWEVDTSARWTGQLFSVWNGGGVMTTGGDLVFQGRGTGELAILDAKSGRELHEVNIGTSMMAAPMSYQLGDKQYVAIMAGLGGALGKQHLPGTAAYEFGNKGRIVALELGGGEVPMRKAKIHSQSNTLMPPVSRRGDAQTIEMGEGLFDRTCRICHANAGAAPDLTKMDLVAHETFLDIVLKGARADKGMGSYEGVIDQNEAEAIHTFLIDKAWQNYESEVDQPAPHQPDAE